MVFSALIKFWFFDSTVVATRIWHNLISLIEEDLAVGLMWKLLFTPLFHDSTFVGRLMSFLFRSFRILIGLISYVAVTIILVGLFILFTLAPFGIFILFFFPQYSSLFYLSLLVLISGIGVFLHDYFYKPHKQVAQIKKPEQFFVASPLNKSDINWEILKSDFEVKSLLDSLEISSEVLSYPSAIEVTESYLQSVYALAKDSKAQYFTSAYFFVAGLKQLPNIDSTLQKLNLNYSDFIGAINFMEKKRNNWRRIYLWEEEFSIHHLKGTNRGWLGAPTPALDAISEDLTVYASRWGYDDFIGRKDLVEEVVTILSQDKDRNVLLVGEAGVGKTALVQYLASQIIAGDAPPAIAIKRLVELEMSRLLSGVQTEGDLAKKVKEAFEEVRELGNIIIFIDEIHNLGVGDAGKNFNLYSLLTPYLESGDFQFIASTEPGNYSKILEKEGSMARVFHKIEVPASSIEDSILIIQNKAITLAKTKKIIMTYVAIKFLVERSAKLIHDRLLPDSALSILEEGQVMAQDGVINTTIIKQVFSKWVDVPIVDLDASQKDLLLNLEAKIHEKMIDQEQAVKAVADNLRRSAASLREDNRPIGTFLFVGPTGVGKTELAKILSELYFKSKNAFVRFDMSEYQTPQAIDRLIGTSDNPGELTEAVKSKPYCLLLLDEFEKASPEILTLFLQVLDDGRLTDGLGKTVDFTDTIIIATSNAASLIIAQGLHEGQTIEALSEKVKAELLTIYKPELVNRFDGIVIFKTLSEQDLEKIVLIKLKDVNKHLSDQGYQVQFSPDLISELGKRGFDPVLGARPLRRLIQDTLEAKLSRLILEDKLPKGQLFVAGVDLLN